MDNIRKSILAALILLALNGAVSAQTDSTPYKGPKTSEYPRHELGVSYGLFPIIGIAPFGRYRTFTEFNDLCPFYEGQPVWSGSVNLQYHYHFNKHNALDLDVSWAMYKHQKMVAVENKYRYGSPYLNFLSVMLGYSVHYYTTEKVSLYSSVYAGGTIYCIGTLWTNYGNYEGGESPVMTLKGALHVNIMGIRVGKNNAATFELGFGTQGVLKFGYSYQFK
jgi:hypothetical protein